MNKSLLENCEFKKQKFQLLIEKTDANLVENFERCKNDIIFEEVIL